MYAVPMTKCIMEGEEYSTCTLYLLLYAYNEVCTLYLIVLDVLGVHEIHLTVLGFQ